MIYINAQLNYISSMTLHSDLIEYFNKKNPKGKK